MHDKGSVRTACCKSTPSGTRWTFCDRFYLIIRFRFRFVLKTTWLSGTMAWVAHPPFLKIPIVLLRPPFLQKWYVPRWQKSQLLQPLLGLTATLAPILNVVASLPTDSIIPTNSWPRISGLSFFAGKEPLNNNCHFSTSQWKRLLTSNMWRSVPQIPEYATRINTSLPFGVGMSPLLRLNSFVSGSKLKKSIVKFNFKIKNVCLFKVNVLCCCHDATTSDNWLTKIYISSHKVTINSLFVYVNVVY